ncbi:hypothetical protein [Mariniflexile sp.]|uniref:hypothetical protein n=1 Tax=Mariniflexile sp. TaxID=1979402 RepID=UPI0040484EB1
MKKIESKFLDKIEILNKSGYFKKLNNPEKTEYKINTTKYLRANESEKLWLDNNADIILEKYQNGANSMLKMETLLTQIRNILLFFFVLTLLSIVLYFLIPDFSS